MFERPSAATPPFQVQTSFEIGSFKVCPLCGNLCLECASDCFVCGWEGSFDHDRGLIALKLRELVDRCPDLEGLVAVPPTLGRRIRWAVYRALRAFRKRLDVRV